ncbi:hypothetical protein KP79_PYT17968 [Mizuhopecten yessoensis]|uniref:Secreted protein n=1 Tax=Mizuhopecten yessoensis TaxID=6573 RepID=A0A210QGS8_MIZYE|nr:hypothetical protein KP79_PYT17968 [Mizuhopecten yessoensis]
MIAARVVLLLALCEVTTTVSGRCSAYDGLGDTECLKLGHYDGYQWATCLTDTYIEAKSHQTKGCQDNSYYCYYQCMCEVYDDCDGPNVRDLCSCDPNTAVANHNTQSLTPLPSRCFSPSGTDCSWYKDCLQKRYPCPGSSASNALTLAKNFCDLYNDYQSSFSVDGQAWIATVRKCLQIELVTLLRPWESLTVTCASIKDVAFASHSKCYSSLPGFCSLSFSDQMRIFWTIKGGFVDAFVDTMKSFWELMSGCLHQITTDISLTDNRLARAKIVVRKKASMERNPDDFAGKIVDAVALKQKWAAKGLAWYGFHQEPKTTPEFNVNIILVQKWDFDLNDPNVPGTSLSDAVTVLGNSVNGSLTCLLVGDIYVDVLSMTACNDVNCDRVSLEVMAPLLPKCTGTSFKISFFLVLSVGMFAIGIV